MDDKIVQTMDIPTDQAEVMKQVDLSRLVKPGTQKVTLRETTHTGAAFQLAFQYHVPGEAAPAKEEPLTIELKYDRPRVAVGETMTITATVTNRMKQAAPMVMVDLPIPAGFAVDEEALKSLVAKAPGRLDSSESGTIGRYQLTLRQLMVYLRGLEPGRPLTLTYKLKPTVPASVSVPPARIYEYYDPAKKGQSRGATLTATPR